MRPLAKSDGFDAGRLSDKLVPGIAAMVDDLGVGFEDAVGEPVVSHELPDIFHRVEFGAFGRQRDDADILGHDERIGYMPPGLIHE